MKNRTLYFGDNLEILRKKIPEESFDLIYLDPPFNSNRSYNVLFKEGLQDSPAQIKAFEDSWHWTRESKETLDYLVTKTNENISNLMLALEKNIGHNDVLAYLIMMTVRLIELRRVLKKTGSLYLHCDPTASHYLKIVLDAVFDKKYFMNEIIWHKNSGGIGRTAFSKRHDTILLYTKSSDYFYNGKAVGDLREQNEGTFGGYFGVDKEGRKYREVRKAGKVYKYYMDEPRNPDDVWNIPQIPERDKTERLGYPTQKPEALLERIVKASSKEGDWVLDPFCGCGTTVAAAEKLKRNWVGIDITFLAVNLIKHRLYDSFGLGSKQIHIDGSPADLNGAKELFKKDPFEFEYWVLDLINAMPAKSKTKENMRGADRGVDGIITFHKNMSSNNGNGASNGNGKWEYGKAIIQVKGGGVQRNHIATLKGDIEREKADAGIFITLEKPTRQMILEVVDSDSFKTPITGQREFPQIQILTVEELLQGKKPDLPHALVKNYYKEAKPVDNESNGNQVELL
jgi:site-specific DNA-methyltransferase (adenine-specific)